MERIRVFFISFPKGEDTESSSDRGWNESGFFFHIGRGGNESHLAIGVGTNQGFIIFRRKQSHLASVSGNKNAISLISNLVCVFLINYDEF